MNASGGRLEIWERVTEDWRTSPARAGVGAIFDTDGRALIVAASSDLRRFFADRLGEEAPEHKNLGGVCAQIAWVRVASVLEADLVFLDVARAIAPGQHRAAADRLRGWFIRYDPDEPTPVWRKSNLGDAEAGDDPSWYLGPVSDKHAAAKLGEAMDDLFELCRYPRELARAPGGTACAYKEMGRCPAACDGSESMDAYRERARAAVVFVRTPKDERAEGCEQEMQRLAAAQRFEEAQRARARLERVGELSRKQGLRWASSLADLWVLALMPGLRAGWVRAILIHPGGCRAVGDFHADRADADTISEMVRGAARAAAPMRFMDEQVERVGVACAHLYHAGKRRIAFVRLGAGGRILDHGELGAGVRSAARIKDADIEERSIEPG